MNTSRHVVLLSCLVLVSAPAAAEIKIATIGSSAINSEGLLQSDFYSYNRDVANIDGSSHDGLDTDAELRRAELILKSAGEHWSLVLGYDAKAEKFLDTNIKYKFSSQTSVSFGQFKQPNSLEDLGSSRHNDFISKSMTTNLFALGRRVGLAASTGGKKWTVTGSMFGREMTRNLANGNGYGTRFTYAPSNDAKGHVIHLGVSWVDYNAKDATADGRARIRARPDADLAGTRLIDSGQFTDAERIRTAGFEAA